MVSWFSLIILAVIQEERQQSVFKENSRDRGNYHLQKHQAWGTLVTCKNLACRGCTDLEYGSEWDGQVPPEEQWIGEVGKKLHLAREYRSDEGRAYIDIQPRKWHRLAVTIQWDMQYNLYFKEEARFPAGVTAWPSLPCSRQCTLGAENTAVVGY